MPHDTQASYSTESSYRAPYTGQGYSKKAQADRPESAESEHEGKYNQHPTVGGGYKKLLAG